LTLLDAYYINLLMYLDIVYIHLAIINQIKTKIQ
jgi:hypothetical protein